MLRKRIAVMLAFIGVAVLDVGAVCVSMPLQHHLSDAHVAAVFSGTARAVQAVPAGQIVTFDVIRVWKGEVARRAVLYNFYRKDIEEGRVDLKSGGNYLVIAHVQSDAERSAFGLPAAVEEMLGTSSCMVYPLAGDYARQTIGDAPGYPPR